MEIVAPAASLFFSIISVSLFLPLFTLVLSVCYFHDFSLVRSLGGAPLRKAYLILCLL